MRFIRKPEEQVFVGEPVVFEFELDQESPGKFDFQVRDPDDNYARIGNTKGPIHRTLRPGSPSRMNIVFEKAGTYTIKARYPGMKEFSFIEEVTVGEHAEDPLPAEPVVPPRGGTPGGGAVMKVSLVPAEAPGSEQEMLWEFIGEVGKRLRYERFATYATDRLRSRTRLPVSAYGLPTYERLHKLSSKFVTKVALGEVPGEPGNTDNAGMDLSYVVKEAELEGDAHPYKGYPLAQVPFVEMIFVYWMEEAMLFQTLNRVVARFANPYRQEAPDPLRRFSTSPLQPLQRIIVGLGAEESHRLTVEGRRREYAAEYGFDLIGQAVSKRPLLERRTQFPSAFHSLLHATHLFYKDRDDKTIDADPFPLLSSLRELHLVLAMGANNRFADLPLRARIETLDIQWMLAQREMGLYLGEPTMIPYEEPWMGRLDTMKSLQGWSDASVTHFYDLAFHGEQLLLSVRHGRWNESQLQGTDAENWALRWKNAVQRYIHAYRAVTGVDLSIKADATLPSVLLNRRLAQTTRF